MNKIEFIVTSLDNPKEDWQDNLTDFMTPEQVDLYNKNKGKPTYKETFIAGRCTPYPPDNRGYDGVTIIIEW